MDEVDVPGAAEIALIRAVLESAHRLRAVGVVTRLPGGDRWRPGGDSWSRRRRAQEKPRRAGCRAGFEFGGAWVAGGFGVLSEGINVPRTRGCSRGCRRGWI